MIKPDSFWLRIGQNQNLDLNPESQLRRRRTIGQLFPFKDNIKSNFDKS